MMNEPALAHSPHPRPASSHSSDGVAFCDSRERFIRQGRRDDDLVVWRRPLPQCLASWLERLEPERLPRSRVLVEPRHARAALAGEFDRCGMPDGPMRELLLDDIEMLTDAYSQIMQAEEVDMRIERIDDNACRLFHRDHVRARLLTTYRGPATEWVERDFAEIALRNAGRFCLPMRRLETHDVALFRGSTADPRRGVVHRSPPVETTGETRLLLCLNERSKVSPEPWRPIG